MNATGCHLFSALGCSRMAPIAKSLASVMSRNGREWSGRAKTGAVVKARMRAQKAVSAIPSQMNRVSFFVRSKRGLAMVE